MRGEIGTMDRHGRHAGQPREYPPRAIGTYRAGPGGCFRFAKIDTKDELCT